MSLAGRVALVTGGGRGVGRGISQMFAREGAAIAVNFRRDEDSANETVAAIEAAGGTARAYQGSVTEPDDNERMVASVVADFGKLDIVIQNGGIASRGLSVAKTDAAELLRVVATHALGPHHLASVAVPVMRENARSDMVFISSVATLSHSANGAPYSMGKAAMESLAFTLAKEERPHGMHVNVVAPGLVATDMGSRLAKAIVGVDDIHALDQSMPFGHVCTPEDIARVVKFLVSDDSGYVTGEKINVHGGGQDWRDHNAG
ncbi:MAG: SDR family oxidoreductase [Actinomycetia bacterium]|nr:SDR family oxidoreductase [Actinomycetes bacterium]MCP4960631.1 SDR family oxidoreductase [Actinomycetes bacterium]